MKHWDREKGDTVDAPDVTAFLDDLVTVCRKHGMCLGHEDHQGAFVVYRQVFPSALEWLKGAHVAASFR